MLVVVWVLLVLWVHMWMVVDIVACSGCCQLQRGQRQGSVTQNTSWRAVGGCGPATASLCSKAKQPRMAVCIVMTFSYLQGLQNNS